MNGRKRMTDRQFVRQYYPDAELDFMVRPSFDYGGACSGGILGPGRSWHRILGQGREKGLSHINPKIIATGNSAREAWRNAKRNIKKQIEMKTIIVGGDFGSTPRASSIIKILADALDCECVNGGTIDDIRNVDLAGYKLVIWAANIDNSVEKIYPRKDVGSILIVTKVLGNGRTEADANLRIFTMHSNAVIAIISTERPFRFKLIDALGNVWCDTTDIGDVVSAIKNLAEWTETSERVRCSRVGDVPANVDFSEYQDLIDINRQVADLFEENKGRYFGNTSTRCMSMFPSAKMGKDHTGATVDGKPVILVSRRNVSKKRLMTDDLVVAVLSLVSPFDECVAYYGDNKPSVDTPIQLSLYDIFPEINYMIHGHSYIKGAPFTRKYFPCGDVREAESVRECISSNVERGVINLRNHGFLIYADNIKNLHEIVDNMEFEERKVGFEKVELNKS